MKTFMASPATIERKWYVIDATGLTLGRLCSDVGGFKSTTLREMEATKPEEVIRLAVKGMLPKGPIGRQMIKKLHIYAGPEHKQAAQKPEVLELKF